MNNGLMISIVILIHTWCTLSNKLEILAITGVALSNTITKKLIAVVRYGWNLPRCAPSSNHYQVTLLRKKTQGVSSILLLCYPFIIKMKKELKSIKL